MPPSQCRAYATMFPNAITIFKAWRVVERAKIIYAHQARCRLQRQYSRRADRRASTGAHYRPGLASAGAISSFAQQTLPVTAPPAAHACRLTAQEKSATRLRWLFTYAFIFTHCSTESTFKNSHATPPLFLAAMIISILQHDAVVILHSHATFMPSLHSMRQQKEGVISLGECFADTKRRFTAFMTRV